MARSSRPESLNWPLSRLAAFSSALKFISASILITTIFTISIASQSRAAGALIATRSNSRPHHQHQHPRHQQAAVSAIVADQIVRLAFPHQPLSQEGLAFDASKFKSIYEAIRAHPDLREVSEREYTTSRCFTACAQQCVSSARELIHAPLIEIASCGRDFKQCGARNSTACNNCLKLAHIVVVTYNWTTVISLSCDIALTDASHLLRLIDTFSALARVPLASLCASRLSLAIWDSHFSRRHCVPRRGWRQLILWSTKLRTVREVAIELIEQTHDDKPHRQSGTRPWTWRASGGGREPVCQWRDERVCLCKGDSPPPPPPR